MKGLILIFSMLQLLVFQNCGSKEAEEMPHCWLNVKYVDCIKDNFPCECEKSIKTFYSLVIDTNSNSKFFGVALSKYDFMEPNVFPIRKLGVNEYEVISNMKDAVPWAKIIIKKDSIVLTENNIRSVFYKANHSNDYNLQHYLFDNVDLLNKSFAKRGYPKLEDIVKADSLICECNKWNGSVNMLSIEGKPQSWILEFKGDSLYINTITNIDAEPDDTLVTDGFKVYKWR